jgi:hypothetical protein
MSGKNGTTPEAESTPTREIVRRQPKPLSLRDPGQLARAFADSGYWKHVHKPAQAVVIMAAGEELGLTPLASMQGITMIEGNIGYRGNLIAQLLRKHPRYEFKVLERTNERCTLQFTIDGKPPEDDPEEGKVTYSVEDAERAELVKPRSNWVKTPRAMCFNRALTEGARVHAPDLTAGTPVYSTEEIEEVEVIDVTAEEVPAEEASAAALDPQMVVQLIEGLEIVKPTLSEEGVNWSDGLAVRLGALGIDAFDPKLTIEESISRLSAEDAERLDAEFQLIAEKQDGEPLEGEVVEEVSADA